VRGGLRMRRAGIGGLARLRSRGPVIRGLWQIGETHPRLSREALAEAVELARYAAEEPESHTLRDEREAEAIVKRAGREANLWDTRVQSKGRRVRCKSDVVGNLPKVILQWSQARGPVNPVWARRCSTGWSRLSRCMPRVAKKRTMVWN
jgi:hypothetical protein